MSTLNAKSKKKSKFNCQPLRLPERLERRILFASILVDDLGDTIAVDGQTTLREAIQSANANAPVNTDVTAVGRYGADTITFEAGLKGTISLGQDELFIGDDLKITGP